MDDSVSVKVDGTKKEFSSGAAHNFSLTFENLSPWLHCINVKHININSYPEPTGNISLISGTVGPCPPVTIVPGENDKDECECPVDLTTKTMEGEVPALPPHAPLRARVSRCVSIFSKISANEVSYIVYSWHPCIMFI